MALTSESTTPLEWPRFCYGGTNSEDEAKKTVPTIVKPSPQKGRKRKAPIASISSSQVPLKRPHIGVFQPINRMLQEEQRVPAILGLAGPLLPGPDPLPLEDLTYSNLMKKMAQKYQDREEKPETPLLQAPFPFVHPLLPHSLFLTPGGLLPPTAPLALPPRSPPEDARRTSHAGYSRRTHAPLDLSPRSYESSSPAPSSAGVPSESEDDLETWGVQRVANFVASIEGCEEYKEVFLEHTIDGSSLLLLGETHLTGILNMKLGPAIRLIRTIKERQNVVNVVDDEA